MQARIEGCHPSLDLLKTAFFRHAMLFHNILTPCESGTATPWTLPDAETNSIRFHDPEFSSRRSVRQRQDEPFHQPQNHAFVLPLGPEDDNPGVLRGRIGADVAEIQVECHQYAIFRLRAARYHRVVGSYEALIKYSIGFEAGVAENDCAVSGQVLVDLEFQTLCSRGSAAVPSRANSAA